jgi:hypothetical protein
MVSFGLLLFVSTWLTLYKLVGGGLEVEKDYSVVWH